MIADHLVIRDLGSTNGIRINGIKVVEGNLQANDELTIGNVRYQLKWADESEETMRAPEKNGIKAGDPPMARRIPHDESRDEPIALPDADRAHPILPAIPASANGTGANPLSLDVPDDIGLAPLDPPSK